MSAWQVLGSLRIKTNGIELSTVKVLEENWVQSALQQTLGDTFTFQQDNNLKHMSKYTLELLTKTTLNFPEWPSYSFELNRLKSMARLEKGCLAMIDNQLDIA